MHVISGPGIARLVETADELKSLCEQWRGAEALALDTEFERSRTFYPHIALIQIADDEGIYLVDPLAIDDLSDLVGIFTHPSLIKVLHGCSEDLEVVHHLSARVPTPLFDTQLAAAFTGYGYSLGYRRLIQALFGAELLKEETRSDWLRRPLSAAQLRYAALDVAYLLPAYRLLSSRLRETGRLAWLEEEIRKLQDPGRFSSNPSEAYLRVKKIHQLDRRALGALQKLCEWREREARSRDIPRGFVVRDPALLHLAKSRPGSIAELKRIDGLHRREIKRSGDALLKLISDVEKLPEDALPRPLPPMPDRRQLPDLFRALKSAVSRKAAQLNIPPQLLADNRAIEALVRRAQSSAEEELPAELRGWRRSIIAADLLDIISHRNGGG